VLAVWFRGARWLVVLGVPDASERSRRTRKTLNNIPLRYISDSK